MLFAGGVPVFDDDGAGVVVPPLVDGETTTPVTLSARANGAASLSLSTAVDNLPAQQLYASLGWVRDEGFYEYNLAL